MHDTSDAGNSQLSYCHDKSDGHLPAAATAAAATPPAPSAANYGSYPGHSCGLWSSGHRPSAAAAAVRIPATADIDQRKWTSFGDVLISGRRSLSNCGLPKWSIDRPALPPKDYLMDTHVRETVRLPVCLYVCLSLWSSPARLLSRTDNSIKAVKLIILLAWILGHAR